MYSNAAIFEEFFHNTNSLVDKFEYLLNQHPTDAIKAIENENTRKDLEAHWNIMLDLLYLFKDDIERAKKEMEKRVNSKDFKKIINL